MLHYYITLGVLHLNIVKYRIRSNSGMFLAGFSVTWMFQEGIRYGGSAVYVSLHAECLTYMSSWINDVYS